MYIVLPYSISLYPSIWEIPEIKMMQRYHKSIQVLLCIRFIFLLPYNANSSMKMLERTLSML